MERQLSSAYNALAAQLYGGKIRRAKRRSRRRRRISAKSAIKAWKKWLRKIYKRR